MNQSETSLKDIINSADARAGQGGTGRALGYIYVAGEVPTSGRFEMVGPTTVIQTIALAGGFNPAGTSEKSLFFAAIKIGDSRRPGWTSMVHYSVNARIHLARIRLTKFGFGMWTLFSFPRNQFSESPNLLNFTSPTRCIALILHKPASNSILIRVSNGFLAN